MEKIIDGIINLCKAFEAADLPKPTAIELPKRAITYLKIEARHPKYKMVEIRSERSSGCEPFISIFVIKIIEAAEPLKYRNFQPGDRFF